MTEIAAVLDQPLEGSVHYRQSIPISGWVFGGQHHSRLYRIIARHDRNLIGTSELFYPRKDVAVALQLRTNENTGFRLIGCVSDRSLLGRKIPVSISAEFENGLVHQISEIGISLQENDYIEAPYGDLCNPERSAQLTRRNIYSTGAPAVEASAECTQLIRDFVTPGSSIFDVGCGIGAYAHPLTSASFRWCGCEINQEFVERMRNNGLNVRKIANGVWSRLRFRLPAHDREFDAAIAIEVLEHLPNPRRFIAEIARVVRSRAIFSVPNMETLPFLASRLVAPWHLLEGDHHNFFSRSNLFAILKPHFRRVEIIAYGTQPLRSTENIDLPYHLMAICVR